MKNFGPKFKWPLMAVFFFLASCQEEINDVSPVKEIEQETSFMVNGAKDESASKIAKNLAKELSNSQVRNFIKEKALEQFDGDYNFLIEVSKGNKIAGKENERTSLLSFGDIISGINANSSGRTTNSSFLDSLSTLYPLLQVAIPSLSNSNAESWNIDSEIPLVAFVPTNHEVSGIIPAYDLEGNYY